VPGDGRRLWCQAADDDGGRGSGAIEADGAELLAADADAHLACAVAAATARPPSPRRDRARAPSPRRAADSPAAPRVPAAPRRRDSR